VSVILHLHLFLLLDTAEQHYSKIYSTIGNLEGLVDTYGSGVIFSANDSFTGELDGFTH